MNFDDPFIKDAGRKLLSTELPNLEKTVLRINEKPKTTNLVWKSGETTSAKNPIYEKPDFADDIQKLRAVPEGNTGIRFKAIMNKRDEEEQNSLEKELTETGDYRLTYFHTYHSLLKDGITSDIQERTFTPEQLKNTTFLDLKNHMI